MSYRDTTVMMAGEKVVCTAHVSLIAYITSIILLLGFMLAGKLSSLITTELVVTNKRVFGKRGIIWRKTIDIPHSQIYWVRVRQGILGWIFDYGKLTIINKDDSKTVFYGISEPFYIKQQIEEAVEFKTLGHTLSDYTQEKF